MAKRDLSLLTWKQRGALVLGVAALPLLLLGVADCAQVLGLDESGTLRPEGSGGTGGVSATSTTDQTSASTGAAMPMTAAVSSSSTGGSCGACPKLDTCEVATCDGDKCNKEDAPPGTACFGGTCDENKKCIPTYCFNQTVCGDDDYCGGGKCVPKKTPNSPCQQPYECIKGKCKDSKCQP